MNYKSIVKKSALYAGSLLCCNRGSKILYYHDVYATTNYHALDADIRMGTHIDVFKKHIEVIRREGFEIVPKITSDVNQVSIMFDDGFRGIFECRDYFYENGISPTIFLPAGFVGRTDLGLLSIPEILQLQGKGFIFECHGWSHVPLTRMSERELEHELGDSRELLSKILMKEVRGFCMPLGFFSEYLISKIRSFGYSDIYSCIPGDYYYRPYSLICRNLCQDTTPSELKLILRGGAELLKKHYMHLHLNAQ